MLVVENQGLPIGGLVSSTQNGEVRLAEFSLAPVRVPRLCGQPRTRPKELVAGEESSLVFPTEGVSDLGPAGKLT